jgi:hypothetical protein
VGKLEKMYLYFSEPENFENKLNEIRGVLEEENFRAVNESTFRNYTPVKFSRSSWDYKNYSDKTVVQVYEMRCDFSNEQFILASIGNQDGKDFGRLVEGLAKCGMSPDIGLFEKKMLENAEALKYDQRVYNSVFISECKA